MKKLLLPLLLLVLFSMLAAVESDPSAVVGYFKKTINADDWKSFALPFAYTDLTVTNVIGDQFAEGDVIMDVDTGLSTTYYDGFGWFGDLADLAYGHAYWINRAGTNPTADYFLLGTVDPQPVTRDIAGDGAWTAFGLNQAAVVTIDDALFGTSESDGDVLMEVDTGLSTTYFDGFGWFGDLTEISPSNAYYYNAFSGTTGFTWTYTPGRSVATPLSTSKKK